MAKKFNNAQFRKEFYTLELEPKPRRGLSRHAMLEGCLDNKHAKSEKLCSSKDIWAFFPALT